MTRPRVYVAGPMRGLPEFNFPAFFEAEQHLMAHGYEVCNPARRDVSHGLHTEGMVGSDEELAEVGFSVETAMRYDLKWITAHAEYICMLPGWTRSTGAQLEKRVAESIGVEVFYYWPDGDHQGNRISPEDLDAIDLWFGNIGDDDLTPDEVHEPTVVDKWGSLAEPYYPPNHIAEQQRMIARVADRAYADGIEAAQGEVRTTSASGGQKGVKPERYDLVPVEALDELARVYGFGAQKYDDHNWRKGYEWGKSYAAAQRHLTAFWSGEDHDPESGLSHLAHAMFHMASLIVFVDLCPDYDDRPVDLVYPSPQAVAHFTERVRTHFADVDRPESEDILEDIEVDKRARGIPDEVVIEAPEWRAKLSHLAMADFFRTEL